LRRRLGVDLNPGTPINLKKRGRRQRELIAEIERLETILARHVGRIVSDLKRRARIERLLP
jgi:hypothetical protein